jgi:enoyl-CoA hydratase/carnithine racemase
LSANHILVSYRVFSKKAFGTFARKMSSTSNKLILVSKHTNAAGSDTGVRVVKFNNPAKLNALTVDIGNEFNATMKELGKDKSVRAIVLTGEGRAFSAGGDLDFLVERTKDQPVNNSHIMREFYSRFLSFRDLVHVPIISAINGPAVGAGLCLASATDIRIAAHDAKMGYNFVALGLHPGMGASYYLQKLVGPQIAFRLLLTGELITGQQAKELGLVLASYEKDQVLPESLKLAEAIAANAPETVKHTTVTLRMHQDVGLDSGLQREADAQALSYAGSEIKEGLSAAKEKRKPEFKANL